VYGKHDIAALHLLKLIKGGRVDENLGSGADQ